MAHRARVYQASVIGPPAVAPTPMKLRVYQAGVVLTAGPVKLRVYQAGVVRLAVTAKLRVYQLAITSTGAPPVISRRAGGQPYPIQLWRTTAGVNHQITFDPTVTTIPLHDVYSDLYTETEGG